MSIYVEYSGDSSTRIQFPSMPEAIEVQTATKSYSYSILSVGDVAYPSGQEVRKIAWSGTLFGSARKKDRFIEKWTSPSSIIGKVAEWRSKKKKLYLQITGTGIKHNVYLSEFSYSYSGGYGDVEYSISFWIARDLVVNIDKKTTTSTTSGQKKATTTSTTNSTKKTYTVVKGDSMWSIAKRYMGNGNKYPQLYAANKSLIDAANKKYGNSKYTIYPGQKLTIPSS